MLLYYLNGKHYIFPSDLERSQCQSWVKHTLHIHTVASLFTFMLRQGYKVEKCGNVHTRKGV